MATKPHPHEELTSLLRSLGLKTMAEAFPALAMRAAKERLTHEQFLSELAKLERLTKDQQRIERLTAQSKLPMQKTFRTLELERFPLESRTQIEQLKTGEFFNDAINIVAIGRPGAGKSHLCCALGHALIELGHKVFFTKTVELMQRLLAAKRDLRLPQEFKKLDRFACVILDDIGYVQQDREEMEVLFTLLAERYERRSVMITTNLVFSEWQKIFKDPMTTLAAIDRIVHHSVVLDLMAVESYRAKAATRNQRKPHPAH